MKPQPAIDMPFTREATLDLLKLGADPEQLQYSHQQIAEWCDRFWRQYMDIDAKPDIEKLMPILADVDMEWVREWLRQIA